MDDSFCFRALLAICIYMRHYIMTYYFFTCFCDIIIDILRMLFQLCDLLICNIEPQLFFCLCKCDPEFSPCLKFHVRRKNILHLLAGIPLRKRTYILVVSHSLILPILLTQTRGKYLFPEHALGNFL